MPWSQSRWEVRCEFGPQALVYAADADAVVLVDVLSFTTAVSVAIDRDARIHPFPWKDERAQAHADALGASLAGGRESKARYSLSPGSFMQARPGERIVVASPNGATLSLAAPLDRTFAGCLRNARAVAARAHMQGPRVLVVPAGERWVGDGSLRPSVEDWIGAGAILACLPGSRSPEADLAVAAWECACVRGLHATIAACGSGVELVERGYAEDVRLAAELDVSSGVPVLRGGSDGRWFERS